MIFKPLRTDVSDHGLICVDINNVNDHLKITDTEEECLIKEYIEASTDGLERWLGMQFLFGHNTSYYNYRSGCTSGFVILGRPMHIIEKVEYFNSGAYVEAVLDDDYIIKKEKLQTLICLKKILSVDRDIADPIRIKYILGFPRTIIQSAFEFADTLVTVTTLADHKLKTGNPIFASGTDQDEFNGIHEIIALNDTQFTYSVSGTPDAPTGTILIEGPNVPTMLQVGVKRMVAAMYANRGDCADKCGNIPCNVQGMVSFYRKNIIRTSEFSYG